MAVNKERVKLWVDALRSGEYQQTRSALQDETGYCCLGVLCDVAKKNGLELAYQSPDGDRPAAWGSDENRSTLPWEVEDWIGLDEGDSSPAVGGQVLAVLNDDGPEGDGRPWTFAQIADHIEQHLLAG